MKYINIVNGPQNVSAVIQGCMRMPSLTKEAAAKVIRTAYDCGVNFYDHATCYGRDGEAETRFAEAFPLTGINREDNRLWKTKGLLVTPHIAGNLTLEHTLDTNVAMFCEDLINFAKGRPLTYAVDRNRGY
ncbi:MAG: aldo/keto reductase [Lachnospiraceae bacterium]|nr:aldo/keto reductase [Lachnospiraceae bacterium]